MSTGEQTEQKSPDQVDPGAVPQLADTPGEAVFEEHIAKDEVPLERPVGVGPGAKTKAPEPEYQITASSEDELLVKVAAELGYRYLVPGRSLGQLLRNTVSVMPSLDTVRPIADRIWNAARVAERLDL